MQEIVLILILQLVYVPIFTLRTIFLVKNMTAIGFGVGILIGGAIENKLAIGYNNFVVNLMQKNIDLIHHLRNEGFGVTVYEGEGRDSKRYRLDILTRRSREDELLKIIEDYEPKAFIVSYEPRRFKGGFLVSTMKRVKAKKRDTK